MGLLATPKAEHSSCSESSRSLNSQAALPDRQPTSTRQCWLEAARDLKLAPSSVIETSSDFSEGSKTPRTSTGPSEEMGPKDAFCT